MTLTQVSRGRLGCKKTHTGCRTCKQRRIKCDERRPSCIRCASIGRTCGGYEIWISIPSQSQQRALQPRLSPSQTKCSPYKTASEHQYFQLFLEQCGHPLAGPLGNDFWLQLVSQLSHANHAFRYAMLMISCLYRDLFSSSISSRDRSVFQTASLATAVAPSAAIWYSKAIKAALKTLQKRDGDQEYALVTCFLSLCIECIQGHDINAFKLFIQRQNLVRRGRIKSQVQGVDLKAILTRIWLSTTLLQSRIPANPIPKEVIIAITSTTPFNYGIEARKSLHVIIASVHNFVISIPFCHRQRSCPDAVPVPMHILELQQIRILTQLSTWLSHAHHLFTDPNILSNPRTYVATL